MHKKSQNRYYLYLGSYDRLHKHYSFYSNPLFPILIIVIIVIIYTRNSRKYCRQSAELSWLHYFPVCYSKISRFMKTRTPCPYHTSYYHTIWAVFPVCSQTWLVVKNLELLYKFFYSFPPSIIVNKFFLFFNCFYSISSFISKCPSPLLLRW